MPLTGSTEYTPPNEMPPAPVHRVLAGQTALVSGASKGLGQAIAIGLARAGARVVVNYWTDEAGAAGTVDEIHALGGEALAVRGDVAREVDVQAMFRTAVERFGRIDICVPNSGIQMNAPFATMTLEQWQRVIDVNLTGQFLCAREAVRAFISQGIERSLSWSAGKIVFMSSVHDVIPWEGHVNYAAAKGGITLLMKSVAQELAHLRIRANAVSPGAIRTPMNVDKITSPEAFRDSLQQLIPAGRIGEPEDVARAVVWLASDESDYVTGTTLYIDGGMTLYPGFIGAG